MAKNQEAARKETEELRRLRQELEVARRQAAATSAAGDPPTGKL